MWATVLSITSQIDAIRRLCGSPPAGWICHSVSDRDAVLASGLNLMPVPLLWAQTGHCPQEGNQFAQTSATAGFRLPFAPRASPVGAERPAS